MTTHAFLPTRPSSWLCPILLITALLGGNTSADDAKSADSNRNDQRGAADLLPATVVAYAHVPQLGDVIGLIADHPLRETIESMPAFKAFRDSADLTQLRNGIAAFEGSMGQPWKDALASLTDEGIHVAFDGASRGGALLIKSSSRDQLERFRSFILAIAQLGQGNFGIAEQGVYRGYTAYAINDQAKMALFDNWLLITNKPELGKSIIDRYIDGDQKSLRSSDQFNSAMKMAGKASATAYVNLDTIRSAGIAPALYGGKTNNVAAEALVGGIVANLRHTPYAVASLKIRRPGIQLTLATPHEPQWAAGRDYFFGDDGHSSAPALLDLPDQLFALSAYRDLSQMWLRAPDLMTDKANEDLAKADSNLTTFFSGRDFGEDILGSLHPDIQLAVCKQTFDDQSPLPDIKLPAFALQFRMRTPEATTSEFRRVFLSFVGFINVVGAMNGQPQLDLGFDQVDAATLVTATYIPPLDDQDTTITPINYNFSPTLAFAGERMVISSSSKLARTLVQSSADVDSNEMGSNTHAVLHADALADVLRDNKPQLVAQNMLEKGHSPEQANAEIGLLLDLINLFRDASMDLDVTDEQLKLTTQLRVKSE